MLVPLKLKKVIIFVEKVSIVYFCVSDNAYFIEICEWFHLQTNVIHTFLGKLTKIIGRKVLHIDVNLTL